MECGKNFSNSQKRLTKRENGKTAAMRREFAIHRRLAHLKHHYCNLPV